jgi:hypothetical protein
MKSLACQMCPEGKRRFAKVRGLCHTCYKGTLDRVKANLTTWRELAAQGLATLTPEEEGKSRNTLFDKRRIFFGGQMKCRKKDGE